ncbi:hypothetical protein [Virgibacillus halodenitrificans]|uniref:hypothetical protein n=1 Tax=Virgibacillus halodenitrificans TaxID=1482 RepID=UPI002DBB8176|nr:hypothetical protein [Virgibacillus halodenitrificans]MEC2159737.1 hypothetical protein [Virgibacillus halodenitrificans]
MERREYRLRNIDKSISRQVQIFIEESNAVFKSVETLEGEAIHVGKFIYLPVEEEIKAPANVKIESVKRRKIDYVASVENKELKECLIELQMKYELWC